MRLLHKTSSRWLSRACVLWTLLVMAHLAWRVRELLAVKPSAVPAPAGQDLLLIVFGFTHLPYWLAGIVLLLLLQFLLFRRSFNNAFKLHGPQSFDAR